MINVKNVGGECCQNYAGSYIPSDFNEVITIDFVLSLLYNEKTAIDWWEGDAKGGELSRTLYLRPRHKNEPAIKGSWWGICVYWTSEKGCSLTKEKRPHQCRSLIPNYVNGSIECKILKKDKGTKIDCAIAWYEYQDMLEEVIDLYYSKSRVDFK